MYLCNRRKLREEVEGQVKNARLNKTIIVKSYQKLQRDILDKGYSEQFDYIVADECHYFTTDALFNSYTDISYNYIMKQKQNVVLLVSATAKSLFQYLLEKKKVKKRNYYWLDKDYSYVKKLYYYQSEELVSIINDILENEADSKILVFCNVGKRLIEMQKIYKDKASYYCSKNTHDSKLREICGWNDGTAEQCIYQANKDLDYF